jgi:2-polyprenyl-3-methyl-5-hydroxy-6-metoxy-1,4-benzoquinol methylase
MDHEWVLTLFGLTAYEAASCGCKVVTIAPSPYHKELAVAAGFASAGIGHPNKEVLSDLLETGSLVEKKSRETVPPESKSIASRLIELPTGMGRGCPVHGTRGPAIYRDREKSYFRCPRCRLVYMERFAEDRESYHTSYFMEEYKKQYGKTYLEDFSSIKSMGGERLSRIRRLRPRNSNLLDIGCAYGPFLAAASEAGFEPAGLDVSTSAVRYVVDELGFPCIEGSILSDDAVRQLPRSTFGVVTLWFVIEHFRDLDALLSRLSSLVEPGGILAFSTPHGQGVSARSAPEQFCERSPRDHFTVWDRQSAKAVLAEFGFQVETIRVTGHHPERYPGVAAGRLPKAIAAIHSKLFGWGDTFEVYARRVSREAVIV